LYPTSRVGSNPLWAGRDPFFDHFTELKDQFQLLGCPQRDTLTRWLFFFLPTLWYNCLAIIVHWIAGRDTRMLSPLSVIKTMTTMLRAHTPEELLFILPNLTTR
jgi:hypothetical protein